MKGFDWVVWFFLFVGGLNWGLIGINAEWNFVAKLGDTFAQIVYIIVGLAALWSLISAFMKGSKSDAPSM
ncbi:hypothetical protein A3A71_02415 [Candidatus Berkelbacteria bacterium RIFCSPLOWO2_01_FULL_50_28]|uniref:DUF378 domain-containing protein n=1 Tax=Candidatus Berkelbacteria bacterium RIFCSPLOWO2_01_FULL_50_28 TaxID=1797471 RepID=A0A1F5EBW4_9BACT|nr:MAG: hypothetical protein A2807_00810 [Candidatus Berkelbacteria bacterium RIFCSPHIGHO2_01_FULL_50_36]OGD62233.1 MAG: hypothetical protein A3F39_00830 [Candidatus Berkelbacteria bacterium RIFCSPHIGHO2_12_FULL_50_11]OGD64875.1 MAG: hypothetical protein A3A71_02415 [Candidatus Berkelbacteria bacterium RIFCSPLOWO2_01_FULL_50_28]